MTASPDPSLSPAVMAVLGDPPEAEEGSVEANGIAYATRSWGDPTAPPLVLVHGITASARVWWRVGPALGVALGRRVVAIDQAGHGRTTGWLGHPRIRDNAVDLVAVIEAGGWRRDDLRVVGHSWGGMTVAWLPALGLETETLVLLDPPAIPLAALEAMVVDPVERHYDTLEEAIAVLAPLSTTWGYGDLVAKAEGLTQFHVEGVKAILSGNGDWDAGLGALAGPTAAGARVRLVRGDPAFGGLVPDVVAEAFRARLGPEHVLTIAGGIHSPMRSLPEATTRALLRALEP